MAERRDPGVLTRMRAALQGERNAATLEAMRDAGTGVYEELSILETRRDERRAAGTSPWEVASDVASHELTTWNGFVLQTLGETLLAADDAGSGFVPPGTFDLAWRWLGQVQPWLSRARQARSNPSYDIRAELTLPVDVSPWPTAPVSDTHLAALLEADSRLRERAEYGVFALDGAKRPPYRDDQVHRLRQYAAMAGSAADYARSLHGSGHEPTTNRIAAANLCFALSAWYRIGQLTAFPDLLAGLRLPRDRARFDPEQLPGGADFDPWCLTDEATVDAWRGDPGAVRAIDALWAADPDPAATLQVKAELDQAIDEGRIVRVFLPGKVTCFHRAPWSSLYEVRRAVTIAGRTFGVLQQFTLDVSAEEMYWGRPFVRRLVLGPFRINSAQRRPY
ncbi:hypothetical protein [Actinocatenispora rupis]|uniref:Uncharacterized protein n=1 Tax=Actinocatenispora rupis TaxID=519421 RepID=A0A8J3J359_9ACTN|nr:hypothetical protein [Actinocatenispora rupis]GID13755.1 hypothetical protein Aru02nite_46440 [Actinocatenispora rupis]